MKIGLEEIKSITFGAARVEENEKGVGFCRFTAEQEALYKARSQDYYEKSFATSGIKLRFKTDSKTLGLAVKVGRGSSRSYFAFELLVDSKPFDTLDNFSDAGFGTTGYTTAQLPLGDFSKKFVLPEGDKELCLYMPWSVSVTVTELSIDDGAYIKPIAQKKRLLCFGDSITHGYDALMPSSKYATRLAELLGADEHNKAIGGEIFFPALALTKEDFEPDLITVAYGTNDWNRCSAEELRENCRSFYKNLSTTYPDTRILAITPIWRKDKELPRECGRFEAVADVIKEAVADVIKEAVAEIPNITAISGYAFVPQDESLFADLRLHPNDAGFEHYFKKLSEHI